MDRKKAWSHYFTTGDREPLVKAYWDSIQYMAWDMFPKYPQEHPDLVQVGLMGLLKAIDKIDLDRVKSVDAWVFLNVRSMMRNVRLPKMTHDVESLFDQPYIEDEYDLGFDAELPEREQLILKLIHVHNYKRTEVAKMFGLSSMRIGQLEKRALKQLMTCSSVVRASV